MQNGRIAALERTPHDRGICRYDYVLWVSLESLSLLDDRSEHGLNASIYYTYPSCNLLKV